LFLNPGPDLDYASQGLMCLFHIIQKQLQIDKHITPGQALARLRRISSLNTFIRHFSGGLDHFIYIIQFLNLYLIFVNLLLLL
jgi:hypothetical protein